MAPADSTARLLCGKCGQIKDLDCFYVETRKGYTRTATFGRRLPCKECHHAEARRYSRRSDVKERRKPGVPETQRRWRKTPKGRQYILRTNLKMKYALSIEDYERMHIIQSSCCAICGRTESGDKPWKCLHVDHDHRTGRVRGLLCARCNRGLAIFGDTLEGLERAVEYLRRAGS